MRVIQISWVFVMSLFLICCSSEGVNTQVSATKDVSPSPKRTIEKNTNNITSIANSKGLIVLSNKYGKGDFVRMYNADGSLWYEFTYYYDDADGNFEYANEEFAPFSFHPDNFVLALKCVGEDANNYEVIVNEQKGLTKFVKKDDPTLQLETWENHIVKRFAVDFIKEVNPLRETPEGVTKITNLPSGTTFHPVEIEGDWLKVRWGDSPADKNVNIGWVRWKENDVILIELFSMS